MLETGMGKVLAGGGSDVFEVKDKVEMGEAACLKEFEVKMKTKHLEVKLRQMRTEMGV